MPREPKPILDHEIISPTAVLVSLRPEDGHGSAVLVSHKAAVEFANAILRDLDHSRVDA